jgi:hypothetical protein
MANNEETLIELQRIHRNIERTRPDGGTGIQGASLAVTLTATSNPYLAKNLPVDGVLILLELDLNGFISTASFRRRAEDGSLEASVAVGDVEFEYRP